MLCCSSRDSLPTVLTHLQNILKYLKGDVLFEGTCVCIHTCVSVHTQSVVLNAGHPVSYSFVDCLFHGMGVSWVSFSSFLSVC